jgi:hypothetical protein
MALARWLRRTNGSSKASHRQSPPVNLQAQTWGEWRRLHPDTTVLSLDTGFTRDYSEGAAYREYFASDRLMFRVSRTDARLRNKAEVLALRLPGDGRILDSRGRAWTTTEDALQATFEANLRLPRVPAHRAFWFGWYAQHPDTLLIK